MFYRRPCHGAAGIALLLALVTLGNPLPAADDRGRDDEADLDVPSAAAGSPLLDDLEAPLRPQTYPSLPTGDPLAMNPEQIRAALHRDVEQALAAEPELRDAPILVHVTSLRRARLSGIVDSESTRLLAEMVAASVDGISGVDNGLQIEAED